MITRENLEKIKAEKGENIGEPYRDENGFLVRNVNGEKILQIEEKTLADKRLNEAINLWRMRSK